jgi:hypothetical protein
MGFGTGLNGFLTAIKTEKQQRNIHYMAIEQYPIIMEEASRLNHSENLQHNELFRSLHQSTWNEDMKISDYFTLRKEKTNLLNFSTNVLSAARTLDHRGIS